MIREARQTLTAELEDKNLAGMLQQEIDLGIKALQQNNPDMAMTFFRSALSKVSLDFPFYDHITHNLLLAYKQRAEQLLLSERNDEAKAMMEQALDLEISGAMVEDHTFRRTFADAFQGLAVIFFQNREFEAAVECGRKAIATEPCPTYHVNLTNSLAILKQPPLLSDFTTRITPLQLKKHIFIACVPKSASTFLKNVLTSLTGYKDLFAVYSPWQTEQELYLPSIVEYADRNTVTQQHCRASEANVQMMQAFGIRPVVLVRNIFDAVVSLYDFYHRGAFFNTYFRETFHQLDETKQVDLIIDNVVPWYLQFVASWGQAEKEGRLEVYWLTYEDLTKNKVESIQQLLEFYGLGASPADIKRLIAAEESDTRKNRFNKGVTGRGKTVLTELQKQRIIGLIEYYPGTDFSRIGL